MDTRGAIGAPAFAIEKTGSGRWELSVPETALSATGTETRRPVRFLFSRNSAGELCRTAGHNSTLFLRRLSRLRRWPAAIQQQ